MEIRVHGSVPATPFETARTRPEPAHDISKPTEIPVGSDPDQRTWTGHHQEPRPLAVDLEWFRERLRSLTRTRRGLPSDRRRHHGDLLRCASRRRRDR